MSRFLQYTVIVAVAALLATLAANGVMYFSDVATAEITSGRQTYDGTASSVYLGSSVGDVATVELDSMAVGTTNAVGIRPGVGASGIAFYMYVDPQVQADSLEGATDSLSAKIQVRWPGTLGWRDVLWFPTVSEVVADTLLQVVWKATGVTADAFAELAFPDILNAGNVSADFASTPLLGAGSYRVEFWIRADHSLYHDENFSASVWATVY